MSESLTRRQCPRPGNQSHESSQPRRRSKPSTKNGRSTTGREARPRNARNTGDSLPRKSGRRPSHLASARTARMRQSRARPGAQPAPRSTGNTASKLGRGPGNRGSRHPAKPGYSEDNRPDPGREPSSRPGTGANRDIFHLKGLSDPEDDKRLEMPGIRPSGPTAQEPHQQRLGYTCPTPSTTKIGHLGSQHPQVYHPPLREEGTQ